MVKLPRLIGEADIERDFSQWRIRNKAAAPAVVTRAALRVLPLTYDPSDAKLDLLLHTFRAAFAAWAGCRYGWSVQRMAAATALAVEDARTRRRVFGQMQVRSSLISDAASLAVVQALEVQAESSRKLRNFEAAMYVVQSAARKHENEFLEEITADMLLIEIRKHSKTTGSKGLIDEHLWNNDVRGSKKFRTNFPLWAREPWDALKRSPAAQNTGFDPWIRWYESLLNGRKTGLLHSGLTAKAEREIISQLFRMPSKFWSQAAAEVNSEIGRLIKQAIGNSKAERDPQTLKQFILELLEMEDRALSIDEIEGAFAKSGYDLTRPSIRGRLNSLTDEGQIKRVARAEYASIAFGRLRPEIESVPAQGPGPHFKANEDGVVDRAGPLEIDAQGNDHALISQLKPLVLRCGVELQAKLSRNQFPELLNATERYMAALDPGNDGEIQWGEIWGLGVVLQNAATSAQREISNRILPPLEDPAKTALDSLLTMHGPMILGTREGARLSEAASLFSMTREEQQSLREAAQQVAERLKQDTSIITKRAAISVEAAAAAIGSGPHPERGSVYGLATLKNVSVVLIGGAAAATPTVIGALWGVPLVGAVVGAPLSLLVVEAVKKSPAFTALVTQLGAQLESMTDLELRSWMEQKARRLAPFKTFVSNNREQLTKIAESTPELRWMLKYIAFIAGETEAQ